MSSFISPQQARIMMDAYRKVRESMLQPDYKGKDVLCVCETFDKNQIETILSNPVAEGLRVYYGMDTQSKVHAILCAVDINGKDIIGPLSGVTTLDDGDTTVEEGKRCPPDCPPTSGFYP
jgi:hypothetical protein